MFLIVSSLILVEILSRFGKIHASHQVGAEQVVTSILEIGIMAHEIESHDKVLLHKNQAWHGLGIVVQDAPTPAKALKLAGLDWEVQQWPLSANNGEGKRIALDKQVLNVRTDISHPLGVVSPDYQPIQNRDLADFCQLLAEQSDEVKVESAGSIRNGGKVWFLLKGESFSVRKSDEVSPYILVSNGHDGGTALRCTPTTIRVVCSNTLHMVIPRYERGKLTRATPAGFVANHLGDIKQKVEDAKAALGLYGKTLADTRGMIDAAARLRTSTAKQFSGSSWNAIRGTSAPSPRIPRRLRKRRRGRRLRPHLSPSRLASTPRRRSPAPRPGMLSTPTPAGARTTASSGKTKRRKPSGRSPASCSGQTPTGRSTRWLPRSLCSVGLPLRAWATGLNGDGRCWGGSLGLTGE
jgi:phage/plasmid-like protein (TIGR03299 family)